MDLRGGGNRVSAVGVRGQGRPLATKKKVLFQKPNQERSLFSKLRDLSSENIMQNPHPAQPQSFQYC